MSDTHYLIIRDGQGNVLQKTVAMGVEPDLSTFEEVTKEVFDSLSLPCEIDYRELRRREYPSVGDQLDAIWKGGEEMEDMREKVNAVKEKYPKD